MENINDQINDQINALEDAIFMLKNKGKGGKSRADNDFVLDDDDDEPDEEEPNQE